MRKLFFGRIPALTLALLLCACAGMGQSVGTEPVEEIFARAGIDPGEAFFVVLPTNTDSVLARQERGPRNIAHGHYIVINKKTHRLHLYKDGTLIKSYPVATGKNPADKAQEDDFATPEGHFQLVSIQDSRDWIFVPKDSVEQFLGLYGAWFIKIGTDSRGTFSGRSWNGIGIHGTNNPASIGTDASLGCVRMHSRDLLELKKELESAGDLTRIQVDILP